MKKSSQKLKIFFILAGASLVSLFFILVQWHFSSQIMTAQIFQQNSFKKTGQENISPSAVGMTPIKIKNTSDLEINAAAAISLAVYPGQNSKPKILFEKNIDKKMPIASISKLMSAVIILENYSLESEIKISKNAIAQEGEAGRLKEGEVFSVEGLLHSMLIESSNDAAQAFAEKKGEESFMAMMNQKAKNLGLEKTFFSNPHGLDPKENTQLNASSVLDLAKLAIYIHENHPLIGEILSKKDFILYFPNGQFHHSIISTNSLLYNSQTLWGKTGYTKKADGCIINLMRPKTGSSPIIITVILGSSDRFYEAQKLTDWLNNSFIW